MTRLKWCSALAFVLCAIAVTGCGKDERSAVKPVPVPTREEQIEQLQKETLAAEGKLEKLLKVYGDLFPALVEIREAAVWLTSVTDRPDAPKAVAEPLRMANIDLCSSGAYRIRKLKESVACTRRSVAKAKALAVALQVPSHAVDAVEKELNFVEPKLDAYDKQWDAFYRNGTELTKQE